MAEATSTSTSNGNNRRRRRPNKKNGDTITKNGDAITNDGNGKAQTKKGPMTAKFDTSNRSNHGGGRKQQEQPQTQQNGATTAPGGAKQKRKMGKRAKQLESMEKKAKSEDEFFRQCQREAAATTSQKKQPTSKQQKDREMALFGKQGAQGINFAKYNDIKVDVKSGGSAVDQSGKTKSKRNESNENEETFSDFDELQLTPTMRTNIKLMNYAKSTPIQKHAIPLGISGQDLMCCAQTGSGKTCAFLLPVVISLAKNQSADNMRPDSADTHHQPVKPKCIVLAPTRELASQIELEAEKLCFNQPGLAPVAVYGGASQQKQLRQLAYAGGSSIIIVATPGRLTDFVDRNLISLREVRYLVLDEADRMLDMGFEPQIRKLVLKSNMTPKASRQTAMFSATFPDKIQKLASEFLRSTYVWIAVGRVGSTTDSITQVVIEATADKRHKLKLVVEVVKKGPEGRTLIFVQKKKSATWLKKQLSKGGPEGWDYTFDPIEAVEIHGDRSQPQREAALAKFRSGECRILVATDVAARGLDISGVEHVINMDLPFSADEFDSYVHRIGRTGRAGHMGLATSFYVPGDAPKVGNRKIAGKLIEQLKEAKQDVPRFLEADCVGGGGGSSGAKQRFGGRDVRSSGGRGGRGGGRT